MKRNKIFFLIITIIIAIIVTVVISFVMKSTRISNSISYIEIEYGIKTEFVREKKVSGLNLVNIFLKFSENDEDEICVQVDIWGNVIKDDYYLVVLEQKLSKRFENKTKELWGDKSDISARFISMEAVSNILTGDKYNNYRGGILIDDYLEEELEVYGEDINIDDVVGVLPNYSLGINLSTTDFNNTIESTKILKMLEYVQKSGYTPSSLSFTYYTPNNEYIKNLCFDDINKTIELNDVEKIMNN